MFQNCLFPMFIALVCISATHRVIGSAYNISFKTLYFDQNVNHFNFKYFGNATFKQRLLYTDIFWQKGGPIFFYTGNEGNIEGFQRASGFLTDHAKEVNALVVFAEHRYYGESLPFGDESFVGDNIGLLSVDQALADYAVLMTFLKYHFDALDAKIITFGGSYGGMLAAIMRFKYPNLVHGALSASAPLYWTAGHGDRHDFFKLVTQQFKKSDPKCVDKVKEGFTIMKQLAEMGKYDQISTSFRICEPLNSTSLNHLYGWVRNSFTNLAMMNYPYATNLLAPLPGHPVDAACHLLTGTPNAMEGLAKAASIFYEGLPNVQAVKCFDIYKLFIECADPTGCGLGNDAKAWDYQACTDILLPGGSTNVTDMFPKLPQTLEMRTAYCKKKYGIITRNEWPDTEWWGERISSATNIIYSNGALDPWSGGGVHTPPNAECYAIQVTTGAHHYDLRGAHVNDTAEVIAVRQREAEIIQQWLKQ